MFLRNTKGIIIYHCFHRQGATKGDLKSQPSHFVRFSRARSVFQALGRHNLNTRAGVGVANMRPRVLLD